MSVFADLASWWVRSRVCKARGHRFDHIECDGSKRWCSRCGREEWVMRRLFSRIGVPDLHWQHMDHGPHVEMANVDWLRSLKPNSREG